MKVDFLIAIVMSSLLACSTVAFADDDINNGSTTPAMSGNLSNPGANNPDNNTMAPQSDDNSTSNGDDQTGTTQDTDTEEDSDD